MILTGYVTSVLYALFCLLLAWITYKAGLPKKYTRKIVHILVGFEWVILYHYMGPGVHFLAVCLLFLALLAVIYKVKLMPMISSDSDNAPGTVYYAVAMSGVALVGCFVPEIMLPFGIGVFCTSVGDGFAGVVGQLMAKHNPRIYGNKTLLGTATNLLMSSASAYVLSLLYDMGLSVWHCLAIGLLSIQLELVTGGGFDNVTITWGTTLLAYGFMYFGAVNNYIVPILMTVPIIMLSRTKKALTTDGLIAALILDLVVSLSFGNFGFITLCIFFVGAIIVDKIKKRYKKSSRDDIEKKNDCRDFMQVIANGGVCALVAIAYLITKNRLFVIAFAASMAEAFADTAASGIGVFADKTYDPFRFKNCEKGLSGGMSLVGTLASAIAALIIAVFTMCWGFSGFSSEEFLIIFASGLIGAVFDSFLGSVLQVKYKCRICGMITEKEEHCGADTVKHSGLSAIDNDIVNIISCTFSALVAILLAILI